MNILDDKWVQRFMVEAEAKGDWSKDPNTGVGCVIVTDDGHIVSVGYNGLPRGVEDKQDRMERANGEKYLWMAHAEENAITNAARHGARLYDTVMFVTHQPCPRCAGMIVNAGIRAVVIGTGTTTADAYDKAVANQKLLEGGVHVRRLF